MTRHQLDWDTALIRYASTVELGGTPQERAFAWTQANHALDKLIDHDHAEMRRKAERHTEELEAAA